MLKTYNIYLIGCDDETKFSMELTEKEADLVKKIEKLSKETSTYGCMPVLEIFAEKEG